MFDNEICGVQFANKAAHQFLVSKRQDALMFGNSIDSYEQEEEKGRLSRSEMEQIFNNIKEMQIQKLFYNQKCGDKNKEEVGFLEMIKTMKNREMQ